MSKVVVNEAVKEWVSRFGSNDEDRCLEQATIGKAMTFIVIQSGCGYLDKEEAFGLLTSISTYMESLSNVEPKEERL